MMSLLTISIITICQFLSSTNFISQAKPRARFIDRGACPFECCRYGTWKTEKTTMGYARANKDSKRIGKFLAGTNVAAISGEVRTVPSRFVFKKKYEKYKPGDVLWVYTYLGEGVFKVWFKQRMYEENLGFSPYGGSTGNRCQVEGLCWGELDKELQMTWWVKIRSNEGWVGWTDRAENFSGADGCG